MTYHSDARYLVFAGEAYYPAGGWHDFAGTTSTLEAARALGRAHPSDAWYHVVDRKTGEEVEAAWASWSTPWPPGSKSVKTWKVTP